MGMTTRQATAWVKSVFAYDLTLNDNEYGYEKGWIRMFPLIDAEPCTLIHNYYTSEKKVNIARPGTDNRLYAELPKFVALYIDVLDADKSIEENLNAMIAKSVEKNLSESAYLNLTLDRIKYPDFVDVRLIFHKLTVDYDKSFDPTKNVDNREKTLAEIKKACLKFQEFTEEQEEKKCLAESTGKEYIKEFFSYAVA